MFPTIVLLLLTLSLILLALSAWGRYCNNLTYRQRCWLIRHRSSENWRFLSRELDAVEYNTHLWYLMTFRDPRRLYGPVTHKMMGWE